MAGRKPTEFKLKAKDKRLLQDLLRDGHTPFRVARRAQILLGRAEPQPGLTRLEKTTVLHRSTIWRVCERYRQGGLEAALYDADRSGRPPVFFQPRTPGPGRLGLC